MKCFPWVCWIYPTYSSGKELKKFLFLEDGVGKKLTDMMIYYAKRGPQSWERKQMEYNKQASMNVQNNESKIQPVNKKKKDATGNKTRKSRSENLKLQTGKTQKQEWRRKRLRLTAHQTLFSIVHNTVTHKLDHHQNKRMCIMRHFSMKLKANSKWTFDPTGLKQCVIMLEG